MFIIFPKMSFYRNKSGEFQRIINDRITTYLDLLAENNIQLSYLLEDEMANEFLQNYPHSKKVVTAITDSDFVFMTQYIDKFDLSTNFYENYKYVEQFKCNADTQYIVDSNLMFKDMKSFMSKSVDAVRKRHRYAINLLLRQNRSMLVYDGNIQTNMCALPNTIVEVGDGKLCIEASLQDNRTAVYYGGVYVPEDQLKVILKVNGGHW